MTGKPPKVFISYSHDSEEHAARVLRLANELRQDGIKAIIDQYFTSPPEGWPRWMDAHVRDDDFVVMVCTETYYRRVIGKEKPGIGLGVRWEGNLIYNHLYDSDLTRFVPVLTDGGKRADIPEPVRGSSYYLVDTSGGYDELLKRLFNRPAAEMPPVRLSVPVLAQQWTSRPPATLYDVPELPPHFVSRPEVLGELKKKLLAANGGAKVGVQGMGGIGKSVMASALVRDDDVRSAFSAGIFWITLGQTPDLLTRQADLCDWLTGNRDVFADAQQGRTAVQGALRERACLVVLDDVWRLADAEAFRVADTEARLLLTTRDAAIVSNLGARRHEVDLLDRPASLRLLAQTAVIAVEDLPTEADEIADQCGDLPLALALAGGMICGQSGVWRLVLDALRQAELEQLEGEFSSYPYRHVFAAIEASVNALGADRKQYLDLAIFPEKAAVPEATLMALWGAAGVSALKVRALMNRFRDRSLAMLDPQGRLMLHDLQRDYTRATAADLPALHGRLVDAYRLKCSGGWASGPDDGYFFQFLPHHLAAAGQLDELKALLADYGWMETKLKAAGAQSLISDYDLTPNEPDLSLVQRALRLSMPALSRGWAHLPSQLIGRLREIDEPRIRMLLDKAGYGPGTPWIYPQTASLTPPGLLLQIYMGLPGEIAALAVLPDGRAISGSWAGTLRLWNLDNGDSRVLEGHTGVVMALVALPDDRALSSSEDGTLRLWDLESGTSRSLEGHVGWIAALAVLPDGRALSGSEDGTLRLWDLESGTSQVLGLHKGGITALVALPDGRAISGSLMDNAIILWNLESGENRVLRGHTSGVEALAVLPDGRAISGGGQMDRTLRLWDLESGESRVLPRLVEDSPREFWALAVLPDGRAISCSHGGILRLWDPESGTSPVLTGHTGRVTALAVLSDGRAISGGGHMDGTLRLWDLESGGSRVLGLHNGGVTALAVLSDGRAISGGGHMDGTLRLWNLESGESRLLGLVDEVWALAVLPHGRAISSSVNGRTLWLWDLESGDGYKFPTSHPVSLLAGLPDGRFLSSSEWNGPLLLWDLVRGESPYNVRVLEGQGGVTALAVLPDGRALSGSEDGTLRLWDLESGTSRVLGLHKGAITALVALPDGRAISGSKDGTLRLWDLESGTSRVLEGHTGGITALAVLPDGRALSGSQDWSVILWDLVQGAPFTSFVGDAPITCVAVTATNILAGAANGAVHLLRLHS